MGKESAILVNAKLVILVGRDKIDISIQTEKGHVLQDWCIDNEEGSTVTLSNLKHKIVCRGPLADEMLSDLADKLDITPDVCESL